MSAPTPAGDAAPALRGPFGNRALRIGRLAGIDIGVDPTWVAVFLLVGLSLGRYLRESDPSWSPLLCWSAGAVASLAFFASIVAHELGHSLVSIALGVRVRSITLFLFGGVAQLTGEPRRPLHELWIAVAGPAVSVALGLAFLAAAALVPAGGIAAAVTGWLGGVNLVLAAFNCFPGFPLDGGRVLRAIVWGWTGDRTRATALAAAAGRGFAWALITGGVVLALGLGGFVQGLWMVLIGAFIDRAAKSTVLSSALQERLSEIRVGDVMQRTLPTVPAASTVAELVDGPVLHLGHRWVFVEEEGHLVGFVTLHEIKRVPPAERARTRVADVMVPRERLATVGTGDTVWAAFTLMDERGVNQVPALADGAVAGVLSRERVLRLVRNQVELGAP